MNKLAKQEAEQLLDGRVHSVVMFLDSLPDINEYRWQEDEVFHLTQEWLCGTFEGREFVGESNEDCTKQMIEYLDRHIDHESLVGRSVKESGWPDLKRVKNYVIGEFYSEAEET